MRATSRLKALLAAVCLCAVSCNNPYEDFKILTDLTQEDLAIGVSFDFPMDSLLTYTTAVAARLDISDGSKSALDLRFNIINPSFESFEETVSFPIVTGRDQVGCNPAKLGIRSRRAGQLLDQQWGWRKGISCDTVPGRWRVIIYPADSTDAKIIKALGFTYKGTKE